MAKWIKYQIVCNQEKNILLNKKLEYTDANLIIAQNEAYGGEYTIEEDERIVEKQPLSVELGGTGHSSVDTSPTLGSSKMVTSDGVRKAINNLGLPTPGTSHVGKFLRVDSSGKYALETVAAAEGGTF